MNIGVIFLLDTLDTYGLKDWYGKKIVSVYLLMDDTPKSLDTNKCNSLG